MGTRLILIYRMCLITARSDAYAIRDAKDNGVINYFAPCPPCKSSSIRFQKQVF